MHKYSYCRIQYSMHIVYLQYIQYGYNMHTICTIYTILYILYILYSTISTKVCNLRVCNLFFFSIKRIPKNGSPSILIASKIKEKNN